METWHPSPASSTGTSATSPPGSPPTAGTAIRSSPAATGWSVSRACPWANRAIIVRRLLGLEDVLSMGVAGPDPRRAELDVRPRPGRARPGARHRAAAGGVLRPRSPATTGASPCRRSSTSPTGAGGHQRLRADHPRPVDRSGRRYHRAGRARPVPGATCGDEIDEVNAAGLRATSTTASTGAGSPARRRRTSRRTTGCSTGSTGCRERLAGQRYLVGDTITEADVRLFTTLVRFDAVYHGHFKCNRQKLTEMPVLWAYARDLFQTPGFGDTIDFDHIKRHYYVVHRDINPTGIVPGRARPVGLARPARPRGAGRPAVRRRHPAGPAGPRRGRPARSHPAGRLTPPDPAHLGQVNVEDRHGG